MHKVGESKLNTYVDSDVVESICAVTGDSVAGTGDSTAASSDVEEVPEDFSFQPATAVANSRPMPPVLWMFV